MTDLHPAIAAVTDRIIARSRASRADYLARMAAARHDLAVFLDGNTLAGIPQRFDQLGHRQRCREMTVFAVDSEFHGARILPRRAGRSTARP